MSKDLKTITDDELTMEIQRRAAEKRAKEDAEKEARRAEREEKRKTAYEVISKHLEVAREAINAAEKLADETGTQFSFSLGYGMGGSYLPKRKEEDEDEDGWYSSEEGWVSSSSRC